MKNKPYVIAFDINDPLDKCCLYFPEQVEALFNDKAHRKYKRVGFYETEKGYNPFTEPKCKPMNYEKLINVFLSHDQNHE